MGKPKKPEEPEAPAEIGDNLTETEEARALRIFHISKLRAQQIKRNEAKAKLDAEAAVLTELFRTAKADTGYQRKEFQELLDDMMSSRTDLVAKEERRALLRRDVDLPVGFQADLFDRMPLEVQDEQHAKGVGYAAGLRGDPCQMPDHLQPRFGPVFADGWGKGQEELSWALAAVGRIVDRKKNANANPVALQPEPESTGDEGDEGGDGDEVAAAADKLVETGWTEPSEAERELETV